MGSISCTKGSYTILFSNNKQILSNIRENNDLVVMDFIDKGNSSSYCLPVFVHLWRAHNREKAFQNLHIVQRDKILSTYLVKCATLYPLLLNQILGLPSRCLITPPPPPLCSSSLYSSASSATSAVSLEPNKSTPACSHHGIPTCAP